MWVLGFFGDQHGKPKLKPEPRKPCGSPRRQHKARLEWRRKLLMNFSEKPAVEPNPYWTVGTVINDVVAVVPLNVGVEEDFSGRSCTAIICEAYPNLKCIVFDGPQVVENLQGSKNLTYVSGDMFKSIPKADAVLLKWILHNWSDKECRRISENCKEAISNNDKGGKIIIMDVVINEKLDDHKVTKLKLLMDVNKACVVNGKERNEEEWKKLFMEAGFPNYKISSLTGYFSLIEIYP
ncbi:hypothetical protein VNO78_14918 [Psophocarpus tetragonolobus]|uniref:O-methyltransferase C-terminal domain-containing protein n=1 Tax=Psophocarpus tetragonolobus TaxID=3891 RepID=A0AAN9XJD4_PSOTE